MKFFSWSTGKIGKRIFGLLLFLLLLFGITVGSFSAPYLDQIDYSQEVQKVTFNAPFTIHFNQKMKKTTVEKAFQLSPRVEGEFRWRDGKTMEFQPSHPLRIGDEYELTILGSAQSFWLKRMNFDTTLTYLVAGPPYVLFHHPGDDESINSSEGITVMFDRPMAWPEISDHDLIQLEPKINGKIRYMGLSAFQFIPENLLPDTNYSFTIPAGLPAVGGGKTEEKVNFSLRASSRAVVRSVPEEGAEVETEAPIVIHFNQPVDLGQIRPGANALLFPSNDLDAALSPKDDGFFNTEVRYGVDDAGQELNNVLIFSPTFPYLPGQEYRFLLKADDSFELEEDFELTFQVKADSAQIESVESESHQNELAWKSEAPIKLFVQGDAIRLELAQKPTQILQLRVCPVPSNEFIQIQAEGGFDHYDCPTPVEATLDPSKETIGTTIDVDNYIDLPWVTGVYFASLTSENSNIWRTFLVEDSSLLLKKSDDGVLVWATDLKSGQPISGMSLEFIGFDGALIDTAITDENGVYYSQKSLEDLLYVRGKKESAEDGASRWSLVSDEWKLRSQKGWNPPYSDSVLQVYLNQTHFQSGQTLSVQGIWRILEGNLLSLPSTNTVTVTVGDELQNNLISQPIPTRRNGSFEASLKLPEDFSDGRYQLMVTDEGGQNLTDPIPFHVQSKPFDLALEMLNAKSHYVAGTPANLSLKARFANGLAAANVAGQYTLSKKPLHSNDQETGVSYSFGSLGSGCDRDCSEFTLAEEGRIEFDSKGEAAFTLPTMNDGYLSSSVGYEYQLVIDLPKSSGLSHTFSVHQGSFDIGLGLPHSIFKAGDSLGIEVLVSSYQGEWLEDKNLSFQLFDAKGRKVYEERLVSSAEKMTLSIPLDEDMKSGVYTARLEAKDELKNTLLAEAEIYLISESGQKPTEKFTLAADTGQYLVGGRAYLIINDPEASEANPVTLLLTYERANLLGYQVLVLSKPVTEVWVPIEREMSPQILIRATKFKSGEGAAYETDEVQIQIEDEGDKIELEATLEPPNPQPGETVALNIHTRDFQGNPISSALALNILDKEIQMKALSEEVFFELQAQSIEDASTLGSFAQNHSAYPLPLTLNKSELAHSIYFNPLIQTDENGQARVELILPTEAQNLYFYLMATRGAKQFGFKKEILDMKQKVIIRPVTPNFVSPGDQTVITASVTNISDELLNSNLQLSGEGFTIQGDAGRHVSLEPGQQTELNFNVLVSQDIDKKAIPLRFQLADQTLEKNLPVQALIVSTDVVGNSLLPDIWSGRLFLPENAQQKIGQVRFSMSATPLNILDGYRELLDELSLESNYLSAAKLLAHLSPNEANNETDSSISFLARQLLKQMNPDGGYGFWQEEESDLHFSAMVAWALSQAREKGVMIDEANMSQLLAYLLDSLYQENVLVGDEVLILWALAANGQYDTERSLLLFQKRDQLDITDKTFLLMIFQELRKAGQSGISPFLDRLQAEMMDEAHHVGEKTWFESSHTNNKIATAKMLYALAGLNSDNPVLVRLMNYLLEQKTNFTPYSNIEETMWMILALNRWIQTSESPTPNYKAKVQLNSSPVMDGLFNAKTRGQVYEANRSLTGLNANGLNDILVQKEGLGPLYFDARLLSYLDVTQVPEVEDGLLLIRQFYERNKEGELIPVGSLKRGYEYLSRLELIVPTDLSNILITHPMPAGVQVLNSSPGTFFSQMNLKQEIQFFAPHLPAGVYQLDSMVQAAVVGSYQQHPSTAQAFFNPSRFAQTKGDVVRVLE